jgi:hypothetical protein
MNQDMAATEVTWILLFDTMPRPALGTTHPSTQWALSSEVNRPESEADHSSLSSTDIKNQWNDTSTPSYVLIKKLNSVAFGPRANYADRATAASWRSSANFADRGCCVVSATDPSGR